MAGVRFGLAAAADDDGVVDWDTVEERYEYTMAS
jgi:hypothetical protein